MNTEDLILGALKKYNCPILEDWYIEHGRHSGGNEYVKISVDLEFYVSDPKLMKQFQSIVRKGK